MFLHEVTPTQGPFAEGFDLRSKNKTLNRVDFLREGTTVASGCGEIQLPCRCLPLETCSSGMSKRTILDTGSRLGSRAEFIVK